MIKALTEIARQISRLCYVLEAAHDLKLTDHGYIKVEGLYK